MKYGKIPILLINKVQKIFSFSYFRDKMKENNISEELLGSLPLKSELKMTSEYFAQWIFNPTKEQIDAENYFESVTPKELSSRLSSLNSSSSSSSEQ